MSPKKPEAVSVGTPSDREIRVERIFHATRERVWQAMTQPELVAQWWGRGNKLVVERLEPWRGGHWRFVEHAPDGTHGFEGRFREVVPHERVVQTFEWDGMPGYVAINTMTLEDLGDGRTKLVSNSLFHTPEERDGMLHSGMEQGQEQSYRALDAILADAERLDAGTRTDALAVRKVAFTMLPVRDVKRARKFYEQTLGLKVGLHGGQGDMQWVEYDLPGGGCFAITNVTQAEPSAKAGATLALEVQNLALLTQHLREQQVAFVSDVVRGPRCHMITCLDSEGNALLLHQLDRPHPAH
jgi:uncharacterized protein YndB with AHSA1/START domain/predicted enzyme related to lactoylglutathione lyase